MCMCLYFGEYKGKVMMFGMMVNIFLFIFVVNFIVMFVVICGVMFMWVREFKDIFVK